MQSLGRQTVQAPAGRVLCSCVADHVRPVGGGRSALFSARFQLIRWTSSRPASRQGGVAMEVIIEGTNNSVKHLSNLVSRLYGMRCVDSSFSIWCNVNDTIEDALKRINTNLRTTDIMRSMWGEKKLAPSGIITANVFYHYAKFTYMDGAQNIVVDVVHPKQAVVTLSSDTKFWQAKEMINEKRLSLHKEVSKTFNMFGKSSEFIWSSRPEGSCSDFNYPKSRLQIEENRLWLKNQDSVISRHP